MLTFTRSYSTFLAISLVILTYGLTMYNLPKSVFWSPDEGAKYLQLQTLLGWQGGTVYQPPYKGIHLDPAYQFYPQHPIYPQPLPSQKTLFHWPIWFPLLTIPLFKGLGLPGLYLIPAVSGLFVVIFTGKITHALAPAATPLAIFAIGLASPIFFYSLLFWEHTLVVFLGLVALDQALNLPRPRAALISSLALAITIALRHEMVFYALAIGLALGWQHRQSNSIYLPAFIYTYSFKIVVITLILLSLAFFPSFLVRLTQHGLIGPRYQESLDVSARLARDPSFWLNLPAHLNHIWVNNEANAGPKLPASLHLWPWLSLIGIILMGVIPWVSPHKRLGIGLIAVLILSSLSLYILTLPERYRLIHSLFLPAPYLLCAIFISTLPLPTFQLKFLTHTTFIYLLGGTLVTMLRQGETLINPEWGARYLLMLYPLLTICASIGLYQLYQTLTWQKPALIMLILGLLLIGIGYQQRGLQEIRQTKRDWLALARAVARINHPILTDFEWLPSVLAVQYVRHEVYVMVERDHLNEWLRVASPHTDTFTFLRFFLLDDVLIRQATPSLSPQNSYIAGEMNFTEFKILKPPVPTLAP